MFDVEIESLRWFSTFTQRSLGEVRRSRSRRPPSSPPSTASSPRPPRRPARQAGEDAERPDIADLLPVERFGALLDLVGDDAELMVAAEEELRRRWPTTGPMSARRSDGTPTTST